MQKNGYGVIFCVLTILRDARFRAKALEAMLLMPDKESTARASQDVLCAGSA